MALSMEGALSVFTELSASLEKRKVELEEYLEDASDEELEEFTVQNVLEELRYQLSSMFREAEMLIREEM